MKPTENSLAQTIEDSQIDSADIASQLDWWLEATKAVDVTFSFVSLDNFALSKPGQFFERVKYEIHAIKCESLYAV